MQHASLYLKWKGLTRRVVTSPSHYTKYYKKSGLLKEISGENKIDEIFDQITAFIK